MLTIAPPPVVDSSHPPARGERFNLQFLFAWITATALLLSLTQFERYHPYGNRHLFTNNLATFGVTLLYGLCCATWVYVAKRLFRSTDSNFPSLAGHWLALAYGLIFTGRLAGDALAGLTRPTIDEAPFVAWPLSAGAFVEAFVWLVLFFAPFKSQTWKWYCLNSAIWLSGLAMLRPVPRDFDELSLSVLGLGVIVALASALFLVLTVMAVEEDLEQRKHRDWLHWVGVFGTVIGSLLSFARFLG